jgi:hypothetical protein
MATIPHHPNNHWLYSIQCIGRKQLVLAMTGWRIMLVRGTSNNRHVYNGLFSKETNFMDKNQKEIDHCKNCTFLPMAHWELLADSTVIHGTGWSVPHVTHQGAWPVLSVLLVRLGRIQLRLRWILQCDICMVLACYSASSDSSFLAK